MQPPENPIGRYHDGTKHHFTHFARSLGYLDWASQPRPFRSFPGAPAWPLPPNPAASCAWEPGHRTTYTDICFEAREPEPLSAGFLGDLLRHSLGLSAWKAAGETRWALRVNPSSGNLHPTEAYVVCGPLDGLAAHPAVYHYAADKHALELRAGFSPSAWSALDESGVAVVLVALTSIHWREAWKYGERAFRYCQHDLGHAIASVSLAAATLGWRSTLLPGWSHRDQAALTGIDRPEDFVEAESEEPGCLLALTAGPVPEIVMGGAGILTTAVRMGLWSGRASQLSEDHVQWSLIDDIARATADPGRALALAPDRPSAVPVLLDGQGQDMRALVRQRRSAVAFDGVSTLDADRFWGIMARALPAAHAPWTALWWRPRLHLLVFVHRVKGLVPGLYLLAREAEGGRRLREAMRPGLTWDLAHDALPSWRLASGDYRGLARRLSCDQAIASDGFFAIAMLADFDAALAEHGPSFYRHLFWESGVIGQALYLAAEATGVRGTGIGCFFDDPVHDLIGLKSHAFQSLYHFTIGAPVDDPRVVSSAGYLWEEPGPAAPGAIDGHSSIR